MESSNSTSLESRVENIERMLSRIESQLSELPNLAATGVDTVDGLARDAQKRGIDIDERLHKAAHLLERLTDPAISDTIERGLELAEALSPTAAAAADTVDGMVRDAQATGLDIDERLKGLVTLAELSTRPSVVAALEFAADVATQGPGLAAMLIDTFDQIVLGLQERGVEVHEGIDSMARLLEMVVKPEFVRSVTALIDVATPRALETTELIAAAMVEASEQKPKKVGLFGLAHTMRKPEAKLVLGFTANLIENLGKNFSKRVESIKLLDKGER